MWAIFQRNIPLSPSAPMAHGRQQYKKNRKVSEKVLDGVLRLEGK
jgi:hypothetical protein